MSETKDTDGNKLVPPAGNRLSLKRTIDIGRVKQSFSHGRSKSVVVEKKRKRIVLPHGGAAEKPEVKEVKAPEQVEKPVAKTPEKPRARSEKSALRNLTQSEMAARAQALEGARKREIEDRARAIEEEKRRAEQAAKAEKERLEREAREAEEAKKAEEAARLAAEDAVRQAEEEASRSQKTESAAKKPEAEKTAAEPVRKKKLRPETKGPGRKSGSERRRGKLTISNALDDSPRQRSMASIRRQRRKAKQTETAEARSKLSREIVVPEAITIQELANRMAERAVDVIKILMTQGQMMKINDLIDADTAQIIAEEMGHRVKRVSEADVEEGLHAEDDAEEDMIPRAPVVTVMGHVDHGKTSLLDALRSTNVVSGEAGGITQHIGAYQISMESGARITFLDTPGHAAFTAMRARGAKATDIVVLVVAADDGVMPQTIEAINHAKAAEAPIIVAINKIDKPDADPSRVRNELLQNDVFVESMGGDILEVEVSATKKTNLDKLEEAILLQAEVLELKANPNRLAEGSVVEAKLDKGRGPVATVLVQRGTLEPGDIIVAGSEWGKVRALLDDRGQHVEAAGPSVPVEVLGLNGTPEAGDMFATVDSESRAREIAQYRRRKRREMQVAGAGRTSLEQMMNQLADSGKKEFPILVKADVQGSMEAINSAIDKLGTDEVTGRIVHSGVGGITESDVTLAKASNAVIIGFNVRANAQAREAAKREGIEIRYYAVIYNLIDDVKAAMSGLLDPTLRETFLGNAEILEVFNVSKVGKVAGCRVTDGLIRRGAHVRLIRDDVVIHEGTLSTLKRFKDEVKEVNAGQECGMAFENYQDLKAGDIIECFEVETIERTL
ncbi:MAG TPA: translation initiation factor IF-2 [Rhizobiales bacterium]|nr:translation initiation factor IF-2 [Hyphomicrobiales bacterium]